MLLLLLLLLAYNGKCVRRIMDPRWQIGVCPSVAISPVNNDLD